MVENFKNAIASVFDQTLDCLGRGLTLLGGNGGVGAFAGRTAGQRSTWANITVQWRWSVKGIYKSSYVEGLVPAGCGPPYALSQAGVFRSRAGTAGGPDKCLRKLTLSLP